MFVYHKFFFRTDHSFKNVTVLINPKTFTNESFIDFALKSIIGYQPILINQIVYGLKE